MNGWWIPIIWGVTWLLATRWVVGYLIIEEFLNGWPIDGEEWLMGSLGAFITLLIWPAIAVGGAFWLMGKGMGKLYSITLGRRFPVNPLRWWLTPSKEKRKRLVRGY